MSWREEILKEFVPGVSRLTLVADPDGLLSEEMVAASLARRGFEVLEFGEDTIAFRYAYEAGYRERWDRGEEAELAVIVREVELERLPYDLLSTGRRLSFSLGELFPNLSYPVVAALDREELDELYRAQRENPIHDRLGENATRDFVLRHLYGLSPELLLRPEDLLGALLRIHYAGRRIPAMLAERLVELVRRGGRFADWPLEEIVPDRDAFFSFLQERWPVFLDRVAESRPEGVREPAAAYDLRHPGPTDLPFDDPGVRIYVDNLFSEGLLEPVSHPEAGSLAGKWFSVGVRLDPRSDRLGRMERLVAAVREFLPDAAAGYRDWLAFARRWAELGAIRYEGEPTRFEEEIRELQERLDASFLKWLQSRYAGLHNLPSSPPVMVHHIPRALARRLKESGGKIALVVLDGLSLDQWVVLRGSLSGSRVREGEVFAWVPTITPVCRQAIFAGRVPFYFPDTIATNAKEGELWTRFWADSAALGRSEIAYVNLVGDGDEAAIEEAASERRVRVLGIVVRMVDEIMHGMKLGMRGMHGQVRDWAGMGSLARIIEVLLGRGFEVYLTSDHGNIEARGVGRPLEGSVAAVRGERVRVYTDPLLRERVAREYPGAIQWPAVGLPQGYLPLLAPGRAAFVPAGERVVSHGGVSLEELVVPFVKAEREN
ncbi:MAG: BREX-3 system phosphatase PglZ [Actinomycetota bacterium]